MKAWMRGWTAGERTGPSVNGLRWSGSGGVERGRSGCGRACGEVAWEGGLCVVTRLNRAGRTGRVKTDRALGFLGLPSPLTRTDKTSGDGGGGLRPDWSCWTLGDSPLPRPASAAGRTGGRAAGQPWAPGQPDPETTLSQSWQCSPRLS